MASQSHGLPFRSTPHSEQRAGAAPWALETACNTPRPPALAHSTSANTSTAATATATATANKKHPPVPVS